MPEIALTTQLDEQVVTVRCKPRKIYRSLRILVAEGREDPDEIRDAFSKYCEQLLAPPKAKTARKADQRREWKENVYLLVREFHQRDWWQHVGESIKRTGRGKRSKDAKVNAFIDLIHKVNCFKMTDDQISHVANQLAYADKHNVPYVLLHGFLMQVGRDRAAQNNRRGLYEDWLPKKQREQPVKELRKS